MKSGLRSTSVGVGLWPAHHGRFMDAMPKSIGWVEVVSENYMPWPGQKFGPSISFLEQIRREVPVALHGVSMNLGSADPLDMDYLKRLNELIERVEPLVVSDHLAWTGVNGQNLHDLLPVPYIRAALELMVQKIQQAQDFLGRRILIENPSTYVQYVHSEMHETEFLNEIVKRTGCGLLLDINNVYVCSVNHGFDPVEWLRNLNLEAVEQIHLAGHSDVGGFLVDTHDAPVCEEVWSLYRWLMERQAARYVMIERDGHIPAWDELETELARFGEFHVESRLSS